MKRIYLPLIYLLFTINLSSQDWFANNPEWCSGTTSFFGEEILYSFKTFVAGDTIIGSQNYKVLKKIRQARDYTLQDTSYSEAIIGFVYEDNEKVYSRTSQGNDEIIYDFSLEVGEIINLPNTGCGEVNMYLEEKGNEEINGFEIRYQDFVIQNQGVFLEDLVRIYEGIGLLFGPWYSTAGYGGFYPSANFFCGWVDPPTEFFKYSNDIFEYSINEKECNFSENIISNIIDHQIASEIKIYPNPCTNEFRISGKGLNIELFGRLTNINGKVFKELKINNNQIINISDLNQGMYFLELYSENNVVDRKILVKSGT